MKLLSPIKPPAELCPGRCEVENCPDSFGALQDPHVKFVVLAKDCDTDLEYVNVEHHHIGAQYKIHKVTGVTPQGQVVLSFWSDSQQEWLKVPVEQHYRLTTAPEYLEKAARPTVLPPEVRKARASHLAQFQKKRVELEPEPSQPTKCIVGQIGPNKVLVDAGDGTILIAKPPTGFVASEEARFLGRTLVGQKDATLYAMTQLRRAWTGAKNK